MANGTRKPMRQGQQNRRGRGRGGRKVQNPLTRSLESNGPDVKIRGTAAHIAEKYATLARDALAAGDNVAGESYLQHAEHYNRIIMANQAQQGEGVNGSGHGHGRANGSGETDDDRQPELAADADSTVSAAADGVARTIARTVKRSSNGAGADSHAGDGGDAESGDAADKGGAEDAPDEVVT